MGDHARYADDRKLDDSQDRGGRDQGQHYHRERGDSQTGRRPRDEPSYRDERPQHDRRQLSRDDHSYHERGQHQDRYDRHTRSGRDDDHRRDDDRHDSYRRRDDYGSKANTDDRSGHRDQRRDRHGWSQEDRGGKDERQQDNRQRSRSRDRQASANSSATGDTSAIAAAPTSAAANNVPDWLKDLEGPIRGGFGPMLGGRAPRAEKKTLQKTLKHVQIRVLMGRGGETVKKIEEEAGAWIKVDHDRISEYGDIVITAVDTEKTYDMIRKILSDRGCPMPEDEVHNPEEDDLYLPENMVGLFVGKGGEHVKPIRESLGGYLFIGCSAPSDGGDGPWKVQIVGDKREEAKVLVRNRLREVWQTEASKSGRFTSGHVMMCTVLGISRPPPGQPASKAGSMGGSGPAPQTAWSGAKAPTSGRWDAQSRGTWGSQSQPQTAPACSQVVGQQASSPQASPEFLANLPLAFRAKMANAQRALQPTT
eukprot:TRINITY_DN20043_c0_g1_i1.p1 TRINITY_DN20043_c0_g1~~TRINITY_DN20043_c0_g1_i1.p1  ORF type:complete len:497 (-),score=63.62 TRINITY_DN20043_c0_g1_i1:40-1476(-)